MTEDLVFLCATSRYTLGAKCSMPIVLMLPLLCSCGYPETKKLNMGTLRGDCV